MYFLNSSRQDLTGVACCGLYICGVEGLPESLISGKTMEFSFPFHCYSSYDCNSVADVLLSPSGKILVTCCWPKINFIFVGPNTRVVVYSHYSKNRAVITVILDYVA